MVKLQLVANTIAKSRSQIKLKSVKGSSINTILIFSMVDASECSSHISGSERSRSIIKIQDLTNKSREGASLLQTRRMWRRLSYFPRVKSTRRKCVWSSRWKICICPDSRKMRPMKDQGVHAGKARFEGIFSVHLTDKA